jgi:hypothetical protein
MEKEIHAVGKLHELLQGFSCREKQRILDWYWSELSEAEEKRNSKTNDCISGQALANVIRLFNQPEK